MTESKNNKPETDVSQLTESVELMKSVAESIFDGLVVIDIDFNIVYANRRFSQIYGKSPSEVIGLKCTEVVGFDHCHHSCPHRMIFEQKFEYTGHSLYCHLQESGPYCISATPLMDKQGNVIGAIELYRDMQQLGVYIGTLEKSVAALGAEKLRLHQLLEDMTDGYYEATPVGVVTSINQKLQELLGVQAHKVVGLKCSESLCSRDCEPDCPLKWAVEHRQNVINSHQKLSIDGREVQYDKSIIIQKNADDEIESVLGVVTNVSEAVALKAGASGATEYHQLVTKNQKMKDIMGIIEEAAPTDAPVLLMGETGTGKELLAAAIQRQSSRSSKPYVKINCSALTESLLESELFGHARGAFTGAVTNYAGKFKSADRGTIFLDEVEDMSPGLQSKLLRVLEGQEFEPVGSNRLEKVDVRIIAASNWSLLELIESGAFRTDLYYRLNVIRIDIPPLRERRDDIPALIDHQLDVLLQKYDD